MTANLYKPFTKLLASLVLASEPDQELIAWRFNKMGDKLRETWAYQEILKEGKLEALRQVIQDVVQARFPEIVPYAKKQIEGIEDTEILLRLNVKMSTVQTVEEALQYLLTVGKQA